MTPLARQWPFEDWNPWCAQARFPALCLSSLAKRPAGLGMKPESALDSTDGGLRLIAIADSNPLVESPLTFRFADAARLLALQG